MKLKSLLTLVIAFLLAGRAAASDPVIKRYGQVVSGSLTAGTDSPSDPIIVGDREDVAMLVQYEGLAGGETLTVTTSATLDGTNYYDVGVGGIRTVSGGTVGVASGVYPVYYPYGVGAIKLTAGITSGTLPVTITVNAYQAAR